MGSLHGCLVTSEIRGFCHVGSETQPSQPARTPAFRLVPRFALSKAIGLKAWATVLMSASPRGRGSIDDHRVAYIHDLVQLRDVVVAEAYAAVRDGLAEFVRLVGAVDAVAVAHFQAELAENLVVVALLRVDGRDYDGITGHD